MLEAPCCPTRKFDAMRDYMGDTRRDDRLHLRRWPTARPALRDAIERIRREAEEARARRLRRT